MTKRFRFALVLAAFLFNLQTFAAISNEKAKDLAAKAVSENPADAKNAIAELRLLGAAGLDALLVTYSAEIENHLAGKEDENWTRIAAALDAVAMQKDAYASRLYWHTDFEKARQEAQKESKPILSLRLLGNLNEELSCANSRFFRAVLYPNGEISRFLRGRYILHWQSVRPVPKVTIDFGDGRKIERTLTGNSIHYVLDSDGKVLDALPGLYSPQSFRAWLGESERVFKKRGELQEFLRADFLRQYHRLNAEKIEQLWRRDLSKVDPATAAKLTQNKAADLSNQDLVAMSASRAANNAFGKKAIEVGSVRAVNLPSTENLLSLEDETDIAEWQKIAAFYPETARLDVNSRALIRRQTKSDEAKLQKLVSNFESFLAVDTIRNEYVYHAKLHEWLGAAIAPDLDKFNDKVYAELFLTPKSDPWLGLYSPDTYSALEGDGIK